MSTEEVSLSNAKKLDRIVYLLEGDGVDSPGLVHRVATMDEMIMGRHGRGGLAHKVDVMWRAHVWVLCTLSGLAGFVLKATVEKYFKP